MEKKSKRNIIDDDTVSELCKQNNWSSLDKKYQNNYTQMKWKCNICTHEWSQTFYSVKFLKTCPKCTKNLTMIMIAESLNLKPLERFEYCTIPMKWKCLICNHIFKKPFFKISSDNYKKCPVCENGRKIFLLENVEEIAKSKNVVLTGEYKNSEISTEWKCIDCDYTYKTSFYNILRYEPKICPNCKDGRRRNIYTFEEVKKIASEKKLICLENEYKNCNTKMKWKCITCDREWETTFRSIVQNIGCIKCSFNEVMKLNLDIVNDHIKDKPFICLSKEYDNIDTYMLWKCSNCSYEWEAKFHHIKDSNSGCPNCASCKTEKLCREYFEEFLGYKFPKKRLKIMEKLELDGYCEDIDLAFEYNGLQHYEFIPYFHKEESKFIEQQERDRRKRELCDKNGICLIEIPYKYNHIKPEKLKKFILEQLYETNYLMDE